MVIYERRGECSPNNWTVAEIVNGRLNGSRLQSNFVKIFQLVKRFHRMYSSVVKRAVSW